MKKLIGILAILFGHSAFADVGHDLNRLPPYQAVETRYIDRQWRRVDGLNGPNKRIREVKSNLIRRGK